METIQAEQLNGEKQTLNGEEFEAFINKIRGEVITPESENYEEARSIYNAMIDKKPALIVQCSNVADVITCVNFARENDLLTSILGGGHNGPGLALAEDGMVIDLSGMKGIRVNPSGKTVRAEAGCTWGDVDHATHAFGLATVSGIISTTGIAGLTLGPRTLGNDTPSQRRRGICEFYDGRRG